MSFTSQTLMSLTEQEYETTQLVSGFLGRCTIFTIIAVQNAFSWHAGVVYRITGYLAPRWRGTIMTIHSFFVLLSMPGNLRMIKITTLAARGYLPWSKAIFEWLWDGSAILVWSTVTWAVYKFTASISLISMSLLLVKVIVARTGLFVFFSACTWALTITYPSIWVGAIMESAELYGKTFEAFSRSRFFPVVIRLCYIHDGFLVMDYKRYLRRTGDALRNQQLPEGLVVGFDEYRYDGLQSSQFRLLRITRSWIMSHFECTLLVFDLHDVKRPPYTAVSYE